MILCKLGKHLAKLFSSSLKVKMTDDMTFPTMWYVRQANALLCVVFSCVFVTTPYDVPAQV